MNDAERDRLLIAMAHGIVALLYVPFYRDSEHYEAIKPKINDIWAAIPEDADNSTKGAT